MSDELKRLSALAGAQKQRISDLESRLALAEKALAQYADITNWTCLVCDGLIGTVDTRHGQQDAASPCFDKRWNKNGDGETIAMEALAAIRSQG